MTTLGGTSSNSDFSRGNTLPLIAEPWGFNSWSAVTNTDQGSWFFHPENKKFYGIRCTHQPSPWISDYGQFRIIALLNDISHSGSDQYSGYKPNDSIWRPYYFKATLLAYGTSQSYTTMEITPSNHGSILRIKFPEYETSNFIQIRRVGIVLNKGNDYSNISYTDKGVPIISGKVVSNSGGVNNNFGHYFYAEINTGEDGLMITQPIDSNANNDMVWLDFDPKDELTNEITIRIATSFISLEQAKENFKQEVNSDITFNNLLLKTKNKWNQILSHVNIKSINNNYTNDEKNKMLSLFYTNLYRASLFPRQLSEISNNGELIHWSPYDGEGKIYSGPITTDSGFWDAYITVYPFLTLIHRKQLGITLQGWLNAYKEGGWIPEWASPGYRGSMVGTMSDVSLADAIVKDIPDFDQNLAYEAIRKDAFDIPIGSINSNRGRTCLPSYLQYGYVPRDSLNTQGGFCNEVVSLSLNYMQSDYAIAQAALKLGYIDDANILLARAYNYSLIFDLETKNPIYGRGFMKSREVKTQKWTNDFDQFAWGNDYTEAGAWQFRFYVPFDPQGLAELYKTGGYDMCEILNNMQLMSGVFHIGGYGTEIHEELEMTENCWGQYAHNNQPSHHILYMFNGMDKDGVRGSCSSKGQYWLRKTQTELYQLNPAMYAGDEDNGEMAAWYILSTLGLFSLSPGSTQYIFGNPLFENVDILIDSINNKILTINAINNNYENKYIQSVSWNGNDISHQNGIDYNLLLNGGILEFVMDNKPYINTKFN